MLNNIRRAGFSALSDEKIRVAAKFILSYIYIYDHDIVETVCLLFGVCCDVWNITLEALRQMEVVHVLAAFVCTEDLGADDFAFRFLEGKDIAVPAMIVMLDNLPRSKVKKLLLEKVLTATTVQVPSTRDLQRLVHACQDDADCKAQVQHVFSGKSLLDLVPTEHKDLHDLVNTLEQFLVPFAQMSVPRLESLCAGRLMQFLAKAGTTNSDEVRFALVTKTNVGLSFI